MNYRLTNFKIDTPKGGNRIEGREQSEFLRCSAINPTNRFEKPHTVVIFDETTVQYYKQRLPMKDKWGIERGGLLDKPDWDELADLEPQDRVFTNGMMYEYPLGAQYCRMYTSDILGPDGEPIPGKKKGDIICGASGAPIVFDKIPVFVAYCFRMEAVIDDTGRPKIDPNTGLSLQRVMRDANGIPIQDWLAGWSPVEVGENMRRLLTPYDQAIAEKFGRQGDAQQVDESANVFNE